MDWGGKTPRERPRGIDELELASTERRARGTEATLTDYPSGRTDPGLTLAKGSMLDRFLVLDSIGSGGMGVVVSAFDPHLDRKVAIKLLRPKAIGGSGEPRERLLREAKAMARVTHPNVITVHEVGEVAGQVFVAMEYIDGGTLKDRLAFGRRDWRGVLGLFVQAGRGLAAAHRKGLVHRDFKPDNVLVDRDEKRVLVTDFGLVSIRDESSQVARLVPPGRRLSTEDTLTETGAVMGTPAYMAPEQHQGQATDARSDQWSFCAALWEGLHGVRPFEGSSIDELGRNVLAGRVTRPAGVRVPGWLRDIALRGMSIEPERRFESMDALLDAIALHWPKTARYGAVTLSAAAAIAIVASVALLGARGRNDSEIAQQKIARLEAALGEKEAERAQAAQAAAAFEREAKRARSELLARVRQDQAERERIEQEQRAREAELLRIEKQMMVLAPAGTRSTSTATEVIAMTAPRKAATDHQEVPQMKEELPLRPLRPDILAGLAEVRPDVMRCGKLRDYSSSRSFSEWERAELSRFSGSVQISFTIRPDGSVTHLKTDDAPSTIGRCVLDQVKKATFSRSQVGRRFTHVYSFPGRN